MKNKSRIRLENIRREKGQLYRHSFLHNEEWVRRKTTLERFNQCGVRDMEKSRAYLEEITASFGQDSMIIPPFYVSQGNNTYIGEGFFANTGLTILDEAAVIIGDHVFLGPGVSIMTPSHPIAAAVRNTGVQYAKPVIIESDVWIGGNVTICPGVVIGKGAVIGAGSVVTKNIDPEVVAAGNPCRIVRVITGQEKAQWENEYKDYLASVDQLKG